VAALELDRDCRPCKVDRAPVNHPFITIGTFERFLARSCLLVLLCEPVDVHGRYDYIVLCYVLVFVLHSGAPLYFDLKIVSPGELPLIPHTVRYRSRYYSY